LQNRGFGLGNEKNWLRKAVKFCKGWVSNFSKVLNFGKVEVKPLKN
jgi:hypothetical protein